jgi:nitroreductase
MPTAARDREDAEHAPAIAVLATHRDRPRDWLVAGMALEHVLLQAASRGLQARFVNQPIQVPELRMRVATLLDRPWVPQAIIELGYPVAPPRRTPRRPVADVTDAACI